MTAVSSRPGADTREHTITPWLIAMIAFLLLFLRTPGILLEGRFWAEEGVIYVQSALSGGFASLFESHIGYYSLWGNAVALLAVQVPLTYAPLVTTWLACAVQMLVIWFVIRSDLFPGFPRTLVATLVVVLAFPSNEVWLNSINSQFHFALGASVLLASAPAAQGVLLRRGFLVVAGLSGPVTSFLTPLFLARAVVDRTRDRIIEAAILTACATGHALIVLAIGTDRDLHASLGLLVALVGLVIGLLPLAGESLTSAVAHLIESVPATTLPLGLLLTALGAWCVTVACRRHPAAWWLIAAAACLCLMCHVASIYGLSAALLSPYHASRYTFATVALYGLMLAAAAGGVEDRRQAKILGMLMSAYLSGKHRAVASLTGSNGILRQIRAFSAPTLLLAVFLIHGAIHFVWEDRLLSGPSWPRAVEAWHQAGGTGPLPIWPEGWNLELPPWVSR